MANSDNKRALFTWKEAHEDLLLREVLLLEPYQFKSGSKERGAVWSTIAANLCMYGMKVSQRSVRERFDKMVKEFKRKEALEERASGIEVEFTDRDRAMTDVMERLNEIELADGEKREKEKQNQATAEEMRKKATERLGETRRRQSEENEDGELVTPEKKRRRNSDVMDVLKGSIEIKRKEAEQALQLREREMAHMENQMLRQEEFQRGMLQQQQQFQQQQQAVTMSILNTLAEITRNLRN